MTHTAHRGDDVHPVETAMRDDGWQPIETAPKDGVAVLLWWPHWWHDPHPGYLKDYQWHSEKALAPCHQDDPNSPTHWMPLPAAPLD